MFGTQTASFLGSPPDHRVSVTHHQRTESPQSPMFELENNAADIVVHKEQAAHTFIILVRFLFFGTLHDSL